MILAIDTTHEHGSLALARGDVVLEEVPLDSPDGFGHVLFDAIAALLERHQVPLARIDCFAAASGPGSFTGVRIGLAAIKSLAEANGKLALGVSNLEALAQFGTAPLRAVVIDARRGEIYGAVYDSAGHAVQAEIVAKFPAWIETLPAEVEFVSPDFAAFRGQLGATRFARSPVTTAPRALAGAIARIASSRPGQDPALVDANYVRRSDAELLWKELI